MCLGQFVTVVPGIIIFSTPSRSQKVLVWIIYSHLVFMINWAFPEYKLLKSLEPGLTSQGIFKLVKLRKIGNYLLKKNSNFWHMVILCQTWFPVAVLEKKADFVFVYQHFTFYISHFTISIYVQPHSISFNKVTVTASSHCRPCF